MASSNQLRLLDTLYGDIVLSDELSQLARTVAVQRLRHIRLSNVDSLNQPGIANISRFEHVIGTAILAGETALSSRLSADDRLLLQASAMLHDAAIAPFGHLVEEALAYIGGGFDHETKWLSILESPAPTDLGGPEMPLFLGRLSGLKRWAETVFGVGRVAEQKLRVIFESASGGGPWGGLIAGTLDIDNLDNLTRLAYHMGLSSDRQLALRIARSVDAVDQDALPVFRPKAVDDITAWSRLRSSVYERLMLSRDDLAAKLMLLSATIGGTKHGDLEPNQHIWTLTDQLLIERLLNSGADQVSETTRNWMAGNLWQTAEPLWYEGPCPPFTDLLDFASHVSEELGRPCFCYRIKDKRVRELRLRLTSGDTALVGENSHAWLLATGSQLARPFTNRDVAAIDQLAVGYFNVSRHKPQAGSTSGSLLFGNVG